MARLAILDDNGDPRYVGWQTPPLPPPDPDPPTEILHGTDVYRWNVGRPDGFYPQDERTPLAAPTARGFTTFTSAHSGTVVENVRFTSNVVIESGCDNLRFKFCFFDPPQGTSGYGIRVRPGAGRVYFDDSTFVGKYGRGKTIYLEGSGGLWFRRCLILGSEDIIHCGRGAAGTMPFPSASCQDFTGARVVIEDSFLGDGARAPEGHIDVIQWDGNGGDLIVRRCALFADSVTIPDLPRASQGVPSVPANGVLLATYGANPGQLGRFSFEDCLMDGGNFTINALPPDGPAPLIVAVRDCKFGRRTPFTFNGDPYVGCSRYGQLRGANRTSNNTWVSTGDVLRLGGGGTPTVIGVTAGAPI